MFHAFPVPSTLRKREGVANGVNVFEARLLGEGDPLAVITAEQRV